MATLEVHNVSKSFGSTKVLREVNINVSDGEFLVLLGPSGCGKSTLGKGLINVLKLTAPDVELSGSVELERSGQYIDLLSLKKSTMNKV